MSVILLRSTENELPFPDWLKSRVNDQEYTRIMETKTQCRNLYESYRLQEKIDFVDDRIVFITQEVYDQFQLEKNAIPGNSELETHQNAYRTLSIV